MNIVIEVSKDELNELEMDQVELQNHIIDTLDDDTVELPAYNIEMQVY